MTDYPDTRDSTDLDNHDLETKIMTTTYSYACADCEGMGSCPGKVIAETENEVWQLLELHAKIAHDEDASKWDDETRAYLKTLIKNV